MRVLSLSGEALGVVVRAGRFYADPQGFRLASSPPGRFLGGGDNVHGALLAGTRRCIFPPAFVAVMTRFGRLLSALRAHGAVDADPQGSRERRSGDLAEVMVEKKADAPREYVRRLPAQEAGV